MERDEVSTFGYISQNWNNTEKISMAPARRMTRSNREVYPLMFFQNPSNQPQYRHKLQYRMNQLSDPLDNRIVKDHPTPFQTSMSQDQLFQRDQVNWKQLRQFFKREGKLKKQLILEIINQAANVLKDEPNIVKIKDPVTIVGDIHGQFYDLLKLIEPQTGGDPSQTTYLFLGDYVDRGNFSIEVITMVLTLKLAFPKTVCMLRGNHESRQLTSFFSFKKQCLQKYDQNVYDNFTDLFDLLPIAAIVNNKFLCIHGGISPDIANLQDIRKIDRFQEIPRNGIFCDLMWADPVDNSNGALDSLVKTNDVRGCSYYFGYELSKGFLKKNKLISIIRAHEAQQTGFKMYNWSGKKSFPTVITIFSAPNYCDFYNNKGAVIKLMNNTLDIQQFLETPHPYFLPQFMDLFQWSIPFVSEKVTQMFRHLLKPSKKSKQHEEIPKQLLIKTNLVEQILQLQKEKVDENTELMNTDGRILDSNLIHNKEARQYTKKVYKKCYEKKKSIDLKNDKRPDCEEGQKKTFMNKVLQK